MTSSSDATPFRAADYTESESSIVLPKRKTSPSSSESDLPFRLPNPSLSSIFASTASLPQSRRSSGSSTPVTGSVFSPPTWNGAASPSLVSGKPDESRNTIVRAFAPHVGVLASADTEQILLHKGFPGGFLDLIRPFGDTVTGKVIVRDSIGSSKTFDDFGIRFVGLKDGIDQPRRPSNRSSYETKRDSVNGRLSREEGRPTTGVLRAGGNVSQIEELIDRHLSYSEFHSNNPTDYISTKDGEGENLAPSNLDTISPFYSLYLRRLLSAFQLSPHETFSHPVACVIAISSRNPSPIEELRSLYQSSNNGDDRLPQWVNNEYLRYYVLVHDEDNDDINKSISLYEQMKRHFGLHCHLLRMRSAQCVASDDDSTRMPQCSWISAGEELAEIQRRESSEDVGDPTPFVFESDVTAIRTFIRELVLQSVIPSMERLSATWNEHIATRRRGITGRLTSLTKRWTPFGSTRTSSSPVPGLQSAGPGNTNYDSLQGFYRPDVPEALMRKLADYAFMLRDYKLAYSTYDLLRQDYENDKAWKYYAGANEMAAISALLLTSPSSSKTKPETLDRMLEASVNSYVHRCIAPYYALRSLLLGVELMKARGPSTTDDGAKWAGRILEVGLVGPFGYALVTERTASIYHARKGIGSMNWGSRWRKAALWMTLAVEEFLKLGKLLQAEKCLAEAIRLYRFDEQQHEQFGFYMIKEYLDDLALAIADAKLAERGYEPDQDESDQLNQPTNQPIEEVSEQLDTKAHRKSLIGTQAPPFGPLDTSALSPVRAKHEPLEGEDDKFE